MAVTTYPSYAYNSAGQSSVIVASAAAFAALGGAGNWAYTPYAVAPASVPTDPGLPDTDTRLQQTLIESRMTNQILAWGLNVTDDLAAMRAEILANDSGLTT